MITSIKIESFRGIRTGELTDLKPLTILTGTNACGKSAVLDALLIGASPSPGEAVIEAIQRHPITDDGARWLIHQGALAAKLALRFGAEDGVRSLGITVSPDSIRIEHLHLSQSGAGAPTTIVNFVRDDQYRVTHDVAPLMSGVLPFTDPAELVSRLSDARLSEVRLSDPGIPVRLNTAYSEAVRQGRKRYVLDLLGAIVPDLEGLEILTEDDDTPALYLTKAGGAVPVSLSGDGIQAFLQLALEVAATPKGLVLVEEPEVYQHPAAIEKTARVLRESARRGVQTVVTTHSLELIDCIVDQADERERADMALYILRLSDGQLHSGRFSGEDMAYARQEAESDLR